MKMTLAFRKDFAWLLPSLALGAVWCAAVSASWERDFLKFGLPLSLVSWGVAVLWGKTREPEIEQANQNLPIAQGSGVGLRLEIFQELAHDIKTPLTSMRYLIDILSEELKGCPLQETANLAASEVVYFQKLVEDLFLLSQLSHNPGMTISKKIIFPLEILESEISLVAALREAQAKTILIEIPDGIAEDVAMFGEAYLIRRFFRNALDNAINYSKAQIKIDVSMKTASLCEVRIRDDGDGFSPEVIASFGTRRRKRFIDFEKEQRISLGLGSVILQSIARALGGDAIVSNWSKSDGTVGGGQLSLSFRCSPSEHEQKRARA